jgi:transposase
MEIKRPSQAQLESMSKQELIKLVNQLFDVMEQMKAEYEKKINQLELRIEELESKIKPKKTSTNSSISPSTDLARQPKKNKKKGQYGPNKGHQGKSLKITKDPDIITFIPIEKCPRTGVAIHSESESFKRHQIIDIEPVKLLVIEIRRQITTGPDGKTIIAPHPEGLKRYKRYGPNLKSYVSYLRFELNVPWKKILSFLKDIVGQKIGTGTLQSIFQELRFDLEKDYQEIQGKLRESSLVGADETGIHVNGDKWWIHAYRTEELTLFNASLSRGHKVGHEILGNDFEGTLLSDFWGAYNDKFYPLASFQKCVGSHLIRDLEYVQDCEKGKGDFGKKLKEVFLDAIYLKKFFIFGTPEFINERESIEFRLNELLNDEMAIPSKEGKRIWKRLRKYREHLLLFLYFEKIPSDNNGSERDIREMVVCRKISGAYKTKKGIEALATIKSVISTMKKQGLNFYHRLEQAFIDLVPEY